jgi:hypothetical protein
MTAGRPPCAARLRAEVQAGPPCTAHVQPGGRSDTTRATGNLTRPMKGAAAHCSHTANRQRAASLLPDPPVRAAAPPRATVGQAAPPSSAWAGSPGLALVSLPLFCPPYPFQNTSGSATGMAPPDSLSNTARHPLRDALRSPFTPSTSPLSTLPANPQAQYLPAQLVPISSTPGSPAPPTARERGGAHPAGSRARCRS